MSHDGKWLLHDNGVFIAKWALLTNHKLELQVLHATTAVQERANHARICDMTAASETSVRELGRELQSVKFVLACLTC